MAWYLVTVERTTVYRVSASSESEAIDTFDDDGDRNEMDSYTGHMSAELDADQRPNALIEEGYDDFEV